MVSTKMTCIFILAFSGVSAQAGTGSDTAPTGNPDDTALSVKMHKLTDTGTGKSLGEVHVRETEHGLIFEPSLSDLSPGLHGFHVHENASCKPSEKDGDVTPGGAAGSHYDPTDSGHHDAPWGDGHLGDLPALYVDPQGVATTAVLSPRLEMEDIKGLSLIIHADGDNYADEPKPLGGGGARVACGVFAK